MFTSTTQSKLPALLSAAVIATLGLVSNAEAGDHKKGDMAKANIVETAQAAGQFNTLLAAAGAAGLGDTLANGGPFTVFAPTDEAFAALPEGTVETLLKPENKEQLANILKFHVLSGKVKSSALADGISVDTLLGVSANIAAAGDGFTIQGANIVATDIKASNGIVHVIDAVILPPEPMSAISDSLNPGLDVIDMAINAGVPMFNHGNASATVAVYSVAAQSLINFSDAAGLSDGAVKRLRTGLGKAMDQRDAGQQAWTLRYALDDVRAELTQFDAMQVANH
ncbi:MAG: fasciclin domain-containing protein [Pseudomonadota bacterium]